MQISQLVAENPGFISFEFFPPKERDAWPKFFSVADKLKVSKPLFCSVTYGAGGSTQDNTLEIATTLKREHGYEPLVHLTTVGASEKRIGEFLEQLQEAGIHNVLALRGDPPRGMDHFEPDNEEFQHASDLVVFIKKHFPDMCVGVAGYPEAHPESDSISNDLDWMKYKVDAGADFIVTQLFFDNRIYFDFVERVQGMGVDVPVIPGVLPPMSMNSVRFILSLCGARIPGALYLELEKADAAGGADAVLELGIQKAAAQAKGLLEGGAPGVHLYTLNRAKACCEIVKNIRG